MSKPAVALVISEGQREVLERLSVSRTAPLREVQRARALLLAADGVANTLIADRLGLTPVTVRSWRTRFETHGLVKFGKVEAGRGRKATIPQEVIDEIVDLTQHCKPDGETHWSTRTMADKVAIRSSAWWLAESRFCAGVFAGRCAGGYGPGSARGCGSRARCA